MDRPDVSLTVENGNRISNASNLLAAGAAYKLPGADQKLQIAENAISFVSGHVNTAQTFYAANNTAINDAFKAVGTLLASDLAKKATSDVLNVAKKVISALDAIHDIHPFVGAAVLVFKGVVALGMSYPLQPVGQFFTLNAEIKRRANDQRVSGLILTATDMMSELLSLGGLSDSDQTLPSGQTIKGRLQTILEKVLSAIEECGNAIDKYHNSNTISKFFKAMSWEEKFEGFTSSFQSLKKDIKNALIIRSALRIEDAIAGVERVDVKLDLILKMIHTRPKIDEDILKEVNKRGGADAVLNNSGKIGEVTKEIAKKDGKGTGKGRNEDNTVAASLLHELRTPLETQLEENREIYQVSLELATNKIEAAINRSESRILHAFNKGAYVRVKDPHLRYVWRVMKWSLSIQTAYFIPALYDYFSEHIGTATRAHVTLNSTVSEPPSPSLTAQTANDEEEPPKLSNEDEWCLEYLSVFYVPTLKEAFDDDTNGLVNVREVNQFTRSKSMPESWSILKRLAYAAVGWHVELHRYGQAILALYNSMINDATEVLPENRSFVCSYLDSNVHYYVKQLVYGVNEVEGSTEMEDLVTERSNHHEANLDQLLARIHYEIPTAESMLLYFGDDRVEHFLMPVIWVLLIRHARLINLAKKVQFDRRELEVCSATLAVVRFFTLKRTTILAESFRQQGIDINAKFSTFYGGLYRIFVNASLMPKMPPWSKFWTNADGWGIQLDTLSSESDTHFGSPDPLKMAYGPEWKDDKTTDIVDLSELSPLQRFQHIANRVLKNVQQTRRWDYLKARRAAIKEYETIAVAAALDSLTANRYGPRYLSEDGQKTLDRLLLVLSPRDLAYCRAKGEMEMRKTFVVYPRNYCDGCHRSPMTNVRYDCLDCPNTDYQLCSDCVNLPTTQHAHPDDTHTLEHNMSLFTVEILQSRLADLRATRSDITNAVPIHDADVEEVPVLEDAAVTAEAYEAGESGALGQAKVAVTSREDVAPVENKALPPIVENCTECGKELPGAFFTCRSCAESFSPYLILCDECAFKPELENANADHSITNHFLVLIRNRNVSYIHGQPEPEKEESQEEEPTVAALTEQVKNLQLQMSTVQSQTSKMQPQISAMQSQISTILELIQALHMSLAAQPAPSNLTI